MQCSHVRSKVQDWSLLTEVCPECRHHWTTSDETKLNLEKYIVSLYLHFWLHQSAFPVHSLLTCPLRYSIASYPGEFLCQPQSNLGLVYLSVFLGVYSSYCLPCNLIGRFEPSSLYYLTYDSARKIMILLCFCILQSDLDGGSLICLLPPFIPWNKCLLLC